jgi:hypothetical protein
VSTLVLEPKLFEEVGGEPSLDDLVASAWEGLAAHTSAPCPVCGGEMKPVGGAHRDTVLVAGGCASCGSSLS